MTNPHSSKTATAMPAKLLALSLLLAPLALPAPLARGLDVTANVVISSTDDLGAPLSQVNFLGATGTIEVTGGAAVTFDSGGVSTDTPNNRLVVADGNSAAFVLDDGATLTFSGNNTPTVQGGAINSGASSTLKFAAGNGARYVFSGNVSGSTGGAISVQASGTLILNNALIDSNTAASSGGAMSIGASSIVTITSATFSNNTSLATPASGNNNTTGGGAIYLQGAGSTLTLTNVLFKDNASTSNGGAISASDAATIILNNVSFVGNSAMAGGSGNVANGIYGGALVLTTGGAVTYNVTSGISRVAGNTVAGNSSGLYFANNQSPVFTVNIAAGAELDMVDPTTSMLANNQTLTINSNGPGLWNLGGTSMFFPNNAGNNAGGNTLLTIAAGTLHLYRAGEGTTDVDGAFYAATTGNIDILTNTASNVTRKSAFNLNSGATLSLGGGNFIAVYGAITFNPGSTLAYDLAGVANSGIAGLGSTTPLLTLNGLAGATTYNYATGGSFNFNLDLTSLGAGTFSLLKAPDNLAAVTDNAASLLNNLALTRYLSSFGYTATAGINASGVLWLTLTQGAPVLPSSNSVLTWTGASTNGSWIGANWKDPISRIAYMQGNIVNLDSTSAPSHHR